VIYIDKKLIKTVIRVQKEKQALEVELAMKKGVLEATIGRKLQIATLSG
jgi:hypothetical protein